jgi:hypothetical protein
MSWGGLAERLSLPEKTIDSLKRLAEVQDHGLRLQRKDEIAFVYDPIILEGPLATYLIEWGPKRINDKARRYVTSGTVDLAYHTLLFPVKTSGWFYVGRMNWTPVNMSSIWPTLSARSKAALVSKLRRRCGGKVEKEEIVRMMEEETLHQLCFELTAGSSSHEASRAFAMEMGYNAPQTTEAEAE